MKVLFLTCLDISNIEENNLYSDLMRVFIQNGHTVKIACPTGGKKNEPTNYIDLGQNNGILRVKTDAVQKVNIIKKGIATLMIESQFKAAIKKHFAGVRFDLVIYSTPPITFAGVIAYLKKRDNAATYLLLKDIFPQNAVDIGMMTKRGPKSLIYRVFRRKEEKLYRLPDHIGCMSQANVDYLLKHNPEIDPGKVHINPNSIEVYAAERSGEKRAQIREKYGIPQDVPVFVYGGNLGKPQDIPFVIECVKANADRTDRYFVICGTGTEYGKLQQYVEEYKPGNVLLLGGLPKAEYEDFVKAFDVGLIFLDHRFTIPNFPSRLLSYMHSGMPVLACTDPNTDVGKVITEGDFGWWCESDAPAHFTEAVDLALEADLAQMGRKGYEYLLEHYTVQHSYEKICFETGE